MALAVFLELDSIQYITIRIVLCGIYSIMCSKIRVNLSKILLEPAVTCPVQNIKTITSVKTKITITGE